MKVGLLNCQNRSRKAKTVSGHIEDSSFSSFISDHIVPPIVLTTEPRLVSLFCVACDTAVAH